MSRLTVLAGVLGASAVAAGAFGAHGLADLVTPDRLAVWETAARYHLIHALALLALAAFGGRLGRAGRVASAAFVLGVLVFSGSLYVLVLTDTAWLGMITPLGGLALIAGWLAVAAGGLSAR